MVLFISVLRLVCTEEHRVKDLFRNRGMEVSKERSVVVGGGFFEVKKDIMKGILKEDSSVCSCL